jgi:hypothetical protein
LRLEFADAASTLDIPRFKEAVRFMETAKLLLKSATLPQLPCPSSASVTTNPPVPARHAPVPAKKPPVFTRNSPVSARDLPGSTSKQPDTGGGSEGFELVEEQLPVAPRIENDSAMPNADGDVDANHADEEEKERESRTQPTPFKIASTKRSGRPKTDTKAQKKKKSKDISAVARRVENFSRGVHGTLDAVSELLGSNNGALVRNVCRDVPECERAG